MKKFIFQFKYEIILYLIFFLSIPLLVSRNLWYDELMTTPIILGYDIFDVIKEIKFDTHPPLYFILLKLYSMVGGVSIISLKLFNFLGFAILSFLLYYHLRKMINARFARIFLALLIMMPTFYNEIWQIRMYILSPLFASLTALYAIKVYYYRSLKNEILFVLWSIVACYTHYVALAFVGMIHLFVYASLIRKSYSNIYRVITYALVSLIAYLPWLPVFFYQIGLRIEFNGDNSSVVSRLIKTVTYIFYTGSYAERDLTINYILTCILLIAILYFLIKGIRKTKNYNDFPFSKYVIYFSFCIPLIVLSVFLIYSFFKSPVWFSRYIIVMFPIILIGITYYISRLSSKSVTILFVIISICFIDKLYFIGLCTSDMGMEEYSQVNIGEDEVIINANLETSTYFMNNVQYSDNEMPKNWYRHIRWNVKFETNYADLNLSSFWSPGTKEEYIIGDKLYKCIEKHEFNYMYFSKGTLSISKYQIQE